MPCAVSRWGSSLNAITEIGGPERFPLFELVRRGLAACNDPHEVVAAIYYGIKVSMATLIPGSDAQLGQTRLEDWLSPSMSAR